MKRFFLYFFIGISPLLLLSFFLFYRYESYLEKEEAFELASQNFLKIIMTNQENFKLKEKCKKNKQDPLSSLSFIKYQEESSTSHLSFREVMLKQVTRHPLSLKELNTFLLLFQTPSSYQLLPQEITIERLYNTEGEDLFKLSSELIKREFK